MLAAGYNPYLEILCRTSKSLVSVLRHLSSKWQLAVPAAAGQAASSTCSLFVHPTNSCPISLREVRWGGPNCDKNLKASVSPLGCRASSLARCQACVRRACWTTNTVRHSLDISPVITLVCFSFLLQIEDIYSTLRCPTPFQLLYSWSEAALPAAASSGDAVLNPWQPSYQQQPAAQPPAPAAQRAVVAIPPGLAYYPQRLPLERACSTAQGTCEQAACQPTYFTELLQDCPYLPVVDLPADPACCPGTFADDMQLLQPAWVPLVPAEQQQDMGAGAGLLQAYGDVAALPTFFQQQQQQTATPQIAAVGPVVLAAADLPNQQLRGLLGLLGHEPAEQSRDAKGRAKSKSRAKQGTASKATARRTGKKGSSKQQDGRAATAAQAQGSTPAAAVAGQLALGMPLPPGMAAYLHGPPQAASIQQQQEHQQQQTLPAAGVQELVGVPGDLDINASLLLRCLDAPQLLSGAVPSVWTPPECCLFTCCWDMSGELLLRCCFAGMHVIPGASPQQQRKGTGGASHPPLPNGNSNFSLKSWASLSPPSNFDLPEDFEQRPSPTAAGAGRSDIAHLPAAAPQPQLGPTDFTQLMASLMGNSVDLLPASRQGGGTTAVAQRAVDALLQHAGVGGDTLGELLSGGATRPAPRAAAGRAAGQNAEPNPDSAALPLMPDKELRELAFEFGSLLGVGDAPSWLAAPGGQLQPVSGQQQQHQHAPGPDRAWGALFGG